MEKVTDIASYIYQRYQKQFGKCIDEMKLHIPEHTRSLSGSLLGYKTIP